MLSETISVYTRRDALRFGLSFAALPLFASTNISAATKDFWDAKASTDWNSEEVDRMLTKSPWAKDASVSFNGGPGGFGTPSSRRGGYGGGYPGGGGIGFPGGGVGFPGGGGGRYPGGNPNGYPPGTSPDGGGRQNYRATVRWESAQPIQDALHLDTPDRKPDPDFAKYYVIQVLGDLPDLGAARNRRRNNDDDQSDDDDRNQEATNERRLDMFKQYTKVEKKDGFLRLEKVEQGSRTSARGPGTLFYFSREDEISADDRSLTFVTKMGPVEIKAKFTPKEMRYHGKLAV